MVIGDMIKVATEDPELLPLTLPVFFGASMQKYDDPKKKKGPVFDFLFTQ